MIKNAVLFTVGVWQDPLSVEAIAEVLEANACPPCPPHEQEVYGFSEPVKGAGFAVDVGNGFIALQIQKTERLLPAKVIREEVTKRAEKIEIETGFKPSRKQRAAIKEDVVHDLLPRAFCLSSHTLIVLDTKEHRIIVGTSSLSVAEDSIAMLRQLRIAAGLLPVSAIQSAGELLTYWSDDRFDGPPKSVLLGDRCELREPIEGSAVARFVNYDMNEPELKTHIESDWQVFSANLIWRDEIEFDLTENVQFKRIKMLDIMQERIESDDDDALHKFRSTLLIACQSLFRDFFKHNLNIDEAKQNAAENNE